MNNDKIIRTVKEFYNKLPKFPDGRINYANSDIAPVITCIVRFGDKILLLKRSNNVSTYKGKWQVVAGYLDEVRPLKEKVLEELREETGVLESNIKKMKYGKMFDFHDKDIGKTWIVNPALVELKEKPQIKTDFEHTEYRWVTEEQLKNLEISPDMRKSIEKAFQLIKGW